MNRLSEWIIGPTPHGVTLALVLALAAPALALAQTADAKQVESRTQDAGGKPEPIADAVRGAIERLIRAGDGVERARAERALAALGAAALEATRQERDRRGESDAAVRRSLERAARRIVANRFASTIRERVETGLYFDGQYDDLEPKGEEGVAALLTVFEDEEMPPGIRRGAVNALADLAQPSVLPKLRLLEGDPFLAPVLKEELGVLMAILGDTSKVDVQIREAIKHVENPNPAVAVSANNELAHLYYRIRKYRSATECYDRILAVFKKLRENPEFKPGAPFFRELALHHYNAACSHALAGDLDRARENLRAAIELDPMHFNNMEKDGDLRPLREAPNFSKFKEELKKLLEDRSI